MKILLFKNDIKSQISIQASKTIKFYLKQLHIEFLHQYGQLRISNLSNVYEEQLLHLHPTSSIFRERFNNVKIRMAIESISKKVNVKNTHSIYTDTKN